MPAAPSAVPPSDAAPHLKPALAFAPLQPEGGLAHIFFLIRVNIVYHVLTASSAVSPSDAAPHTKLGLAFRDPK